MSDAVRPRGSYSAAFVVLVITMLALGAAALTVIFGSKGAFPIEVFGSASSGSADPVDAAIRGDGAGGVLRGLVSGFQIAEPPPWDSTGSGWRSPDPLLDEARLASTALNWPKAIAAYDQILRRPNVPDSLVIERARVLSWAGEPLRAGAALRGLAQQRPLNGAFRAEAAQYYWWGGDAVTADELMSEARGLGLEGAEVDSFQAQLRGAITPDVRTARRWVSESGQWQDQLALARAHLAESQWKEALVAYQDALDTRMAPDSVYLELAATAAAADSAELAIAALGEYLHLHPSQDEVRLSLARAYQWALRYDASIEEYATYLALNDDPEVRFELAQILSWTNRNDAAATELRRVALQRPTHAPTYRLLGDLALWRGDYELAIANYRYASDLAPGDPTSAVALGTAEQAYAASRIASMPLSLGQCAIQVDSFSDSEGFSWTSTRGSRAFDTGWGLLEVAVQQDLSRADLALTPGRRLGGLGATASLRVPVSRAASLDLLGGISDYGDFGSYVVGGLGVELQQVAGATVSARYRHQPAFMRAATLAALEAGTTSDLLEMTFSRPLGAWSTWLGLEAERLKSEYGVTRRYGANASVTRTITPRVSLSTTVSMIGTTGDLPRLPDGRALYWTPELYVAPSIGVSYRMAVGQHWTVGGTMSPGMAYVRERSDTERRFGSNFVPTLGMALDAAYRVGDWEIGGVARWGGSVDATGYRSSTVQLKGAYRLDQLDPP